MKYGHCLENARGESVLFCNVVAHKAARCCTSCFWVVAKQVACGGFIRASDKNSCMLLLEIRLMMLSVSQKTQTMRLTVLKICRVGLFQHQALLHNCICSIIKNNRVSRTELRKCTVSVCACVHIQQRQDAEKTQHTERREGDCS